MKDIRVILVVLFLFLAAEAFADDPNVFVASGSKVAGRPGKSTAWKEVKVGQSCTLTLKKGEKIFIGMCNTLNKRKRKSWRVKIDVISGLSSSEKKKMFKTSASASVRSGSKWVAADSAMKVSGSDPYTYDVVFDHQPPAERLEFTNPSENEKTITFKVIENKIDVTLCVKTNSPSSERMQFEMLYGSLQAGGDARMTEVWMCPHNYAVKNSPPPECNMPPGSGSWSYSIEDYDPNGDYRPNKVVKYFSDGQGLGIEHKFTVAFSMTGDVNNMYDVYSHNAQSGYYEQVLVYTGPMPVIEQVRSYGDHAGNELAFDVDGKVFNVEPRMSGIAKLEIEFALEMDPYTATDPCNLVVTPAGGVAISSDIYLTLNGPNNTKLTVEFDPPLPNQYCYEIDVGQMTTTNEFLVSNGVFPIRALVGDVTRDGYVSQDDIDEVDIYLGQVVNSQNFHCDIDGNGTVNSTDHTQVLNRLGNKVAGCGGRCGDDYHPYPAGDVDGDCDVDFVDFAFFADMWLGQTCIPPNCQP